jgi:hypothetical protein
MSNINPQSIDGTFPIAGQDNNSQGFRDNFTGTINNFTRAAAELSDLQTFAVVTGPLTSVGQTGTPTNNMNYTYLTKPQLLGAVETSKNIGNIATSGTIQVDWSQGHYQTVGATGTVGLTFTSTWPTTSLYTKLRLQIKAWGTTVINLDSTARPVNINSIQGVSGNVLTLSDGLYAFEFATSDAGATLSIVDLWRNYDAAIDFSQLNVTGNVLSTGLSVFGNARVGLAGAVSGQFHSVVGNITQTSSGGAVYFNTTGNVLAAGGILNALTVNGTTTRAGATVDSSYQIYKPTANVSIQANVNVSRVIVAPTPSGSISSFWTDVILPNVSTNGHTITVSSNVRIETFRVLSPWVGVYTVDTGANVTLANNTPATFIFHSTENKWFRV